MLNNVDHTETIINMRKRTTRLEHEGDYWNEDEKEKLRQLFEQGVGITEISIQLQRTEPAVCQQIEKLDLYGRRDSPMRRRKKKTPSCLCERCECPGCSCPRYLQCQKMREVE